MTHSVDGEIREAFSYTYDRRGNQLSKIQNGEETRYHYDAKSNVAYLPNGLTQHYIFDPLDNIKTMYEIRDGVIGTVEYNYDANSRLVRREHIQSTQGREVFLYSYDKEGNLTQKDHLAGNSEIIPFAGTWNYRYNGFNQMITAENPDGIIASYGYAGDGLRAYKEYAGNTINFFYDNKNITLETDEKGHVTARNVFSIRGIEARISEITDNQPLYHIKDAHGDVIGLWDGHNNPLKSIAYDPYGNKLNTELAVWNGNVLTLFHQQEASVSSPFEYCGEYTDGETGFVYLRARYLDPVIGRFTQQDGWEYSDIKDPLSLNLYTYGHNNPISYHDPTGHIPVEVLDQLSRIPGVYELLQQLQTYADQAGMALQDFVARNFPQLQQLVNEVGKFGPAAYDYISSGQAWSDIKSGAQYVGDKVRSGYNNVKNWMSGGGSTSPSDPNWNGGFKNFSQLKKYLGDPGKGNVYHHIVEQSQIKKSGFDPTTVHNVNNVIKVTKEMNDKLNGYYSQAQSFTNGMKLRDWLAGQSFEIQHQEGLKALKHFGIIP